MTFGAGPPSPPVSTDVDTDAPHAHTRECGHHSDTPASVLCLSPAYSLCYLSHVIAAKKSLNSQFVKKSPICRDGGVLKGDVQNRMQSRGAYKTRCCSNVAHVQACVTATPSSVPFVVATRYPEGALSITTLGRTAPRPLGYHIPQARVEFDTLLGPGDAIINTPAGAGATPMLPAIGVFGVFGQLVLAFQKGTVARVSKILGQDLRGDVPTDLTNQVRPPPRSCGIPHCNCNCHTPVSCANDNGITWSKYDE